MEIRDLPKRYRRQAETKYSRQLKTKNKRFKQSGNRDNVTVGDYGKTLSEGKSGGKSKYHNRKVSLDGHTFDSEMEARRYSQLKMLEEAGVIQDLKLQVPFELVPAFVKNGVKFSSLVYVADFVYIEKGKTIVEDVKGFRTKEYKIKRKLFESMHDDITITEVSDA